MQTRRAVEYWESEHPGERSRLADEVALVLELLADFPDLGIGVGRGRRRRLLLPDVGPVCLPAIALTVGELFRAPR